MGRKIVIAFFLVALISCKKATHVEIQAEDYITGSGNAYEGMEYAVVEVWIPFFETKSKIVKTGFLDDNGYASFDLKMKNNRKYIIDVAQPENICYGGHQQQHLEHEHNNNLHFKYLKCGYLNLPRVNLNCENSQDKFRLKYYYAIDQAVYLYSGYLDENHNWDPNKYLEGCIDLSGVYVYNLVPVGEYVIEWQVERQSGTTSNAVTILVSESDTTNYLIEY